MRFIVLFALMSCLMISAAAAHMDCAQRSLVVDKLLVEFKEKQVALGLDSGGRVIELFISSTGNFTILVSYTDGQSCVAATGEGWQTVGLRTRR